MDNVSVVFEDLAAAVAFFSELGLELEGEMTIEGDWADRIVGLKASRHRHDEDTGRCKELRRRQTRRSRRLIASLKSHTAPIGVSEPNSAIIARSDLRPSPAKTDR
jgi:hypothetical protein